MKVTPTPIDGVFCIESDISEDLRGIFVKTYHADIFAEYELETNFRESFYSVSRRNVIRGMHYQQPPQDHVKLVYVTDGEIVDVAVDIRKSSPTFGNYYSTLLSSRNVKSLYMGKGIAHGFLTNTDRAVVVYLTSTVHAPDFDRGVHWNSFGYEWGVENPIVSERDQSFSQLKDLV